MKKLLLLPALASLMFSLVSCGSSGYSSYALDPCASRALRHQQHYKGTVENGRYYESSGLFSIAIPASGLADADEIRHREAASISLLVLDCEGAMQTIEVGPLPGDILGATKQSSQFANRFLEALASAFLEKFNESGTSNAKLISKEFVQLPERGDAFFGVLSCGGGTTQGILFFYDGNYVVNIMTDDEACTSKTASDHLLKNHILDVAQAFRLKNAVKCTAN